jgi:hypothetical protein
VNGKFKSNTNMKSKLQIQIPAAILFLILSLAVAPAQPAPPNAPTVNPTTGLPAGGWPPTLDPATGLPVPPPAPQWIDPNWSDPDIVLNDVVYDGLPLSEVARDLRERFKDSFDILPMPKTFGKDWGGETIRLQLKNVRASETFNAMNLVFENDRTPLRWELKQSPGRRGMVQLRVLPEAALKDVPQTKPPETHRVVYFVGNLIGDEKSGGMTMDQIIKTISEIWPTDFGKPEGAIQFHKDAQLLVVNGTPDQLEFVHQTLAALEQKVESAHPKSAEAKAIEQQVNLIKSLKSIGDSSK